MPLGIINDKDFESELNNCSVPIINNTNFNSPKPRASDSIDNSLEIPSEDNSQETASQIVSFPQSEARGRGITHTQVRSGIRKIIGETSVINGRRDALELADMFGISPSSVSAYKEGAHSTATINQPNPDTKLHINAARLRITKRANKKLNLALSYITEDKLQEAKVGEIASVVKAMSGVIKDMEPDSDNGKDNKSNVPYVVFAPIIRNENTFEVVHAKDDY